jgi:pSer/pThr/pTyr-binding forkhead associated (FHA) protein
MALHKLKVTAGPEEGRTVDLEGEVVIGRGDDAGLVITDGELSRRHAIVRATANGVEVEDLGSLNGTFVNGDRIEGTVALAPGETLRVGTSHMEVEVVEQAPSASAAPPADATRVRATPPPAPEPPAVPPADATRIRPTPAGAGPPPVAPAPPPAAPVAAAVPPPAGPPAGGPPAGGPPGFGPPGEMPRIPPPVRLMLKILTKVPPGRLLMKRLVKMPMKRRVHVLIFMTFLMFAIPVAIILVLFVL